MASKKRARESAIAQPVVNKEWLDRFSERKLPQVLQSVRDKKPTAVADFVRLVQLEWQRNPVKPQARPITWIDRLDRDAEDQHPK